MPSWGWAFEKRGDPHSWQKPLPHSPIVLVYPSWESPSVSIIDTMLRTSTEFCIFSFSPLSGLPSLKEEMRNVCSGWNEVWKEAFIFILLLEIKETFSPNSSYGLLRCPVTGKPLSLSPSSFGCVGKDAHMRDEKCLKHAIREKMIFFVLIPSSSISFLMAKERRGRSVGPCSLPLLLWFCLLSTTCMQQHTAGIHLKGRLQISVRHASRGWGASVPVSTHAWFSPLSIVSLFTVPSSIPVTGRVANRTRTLFLPAASNCRDETSRWWTSRKSSLLESSHACLSPSSTKRECTHWTLNIQHSTDSILISSRASIKENKRTYVFFATLQECESTCIVSFQFFHYNPTNFCQWLIVDGMIS